MNRTRVWLAVSPVVAGGVLVGHALAYRVTGAPAGSLHGYLDHAPQVLLVLAIVGLAFAGLGARLRSPATWTFPVAALAVFVVQEHVERAAHAHEVVLVASPVLLVGLALQIPVAIAAWALARLLLRAVESLSVHRRALPRLAFELLAPTGAEPARDSAQVRSGRGPPKLLRR